MFSLNPLFFSFFSLSFQDSNSQKKEKNVFNVTEERWLRRRRMIAFGKEGGGGKGLPERKRGFKYYLYMKVTKLLKLCR